MSERLSVNIRALMMMVWRDWKYLKLFRMSFFMSLVDPVIQALVVILMARFGTGHVDGVDLKTYIVVGVIASRFSNAALLAPYNFLYLSFWNNRLEWLLMSQADLPFLMLGSCVVRYIQVIIEALALAVVGLLCGVSLNISFISLLICLPQVIIGLLAVYGIGLISASMMYHLDARGGSDPVRFVVSSLSSLVSGVYFPPDELPVWLRFLSELLPQTHLLRCVRYVTTASFKSTTDVLVDSMLRHEMVVLVVLCLIFVTLGTHLLKSGLLRARLDGRLSRWV